MVNIKNCIVRSNRFMVKCIHNPVKSKQVCNFWATFDIVFQSIFSNSPVPQRVRKNSEECEIRCGAFEIIGVNHSQTITFLIALFFYFWGAMLDVMGVLLSMFILYVQIVNLMSSQINTVALVNIIATTMFAASCRGRVKSLKMLMYWNFLGDPKNTVEIIA